MTSACVGQPDEPRSRYPAADFRLEVEESSPPDEGAAVRRRVVITADGTVIYRAASREGLTLLDGVVEPVFGTAVAYRLVPEATRLLARKVVLRGIDDAPGGPEGADDGDGVRGVDRAGNALTIAYSAFGAHRVVPLLGTPRGRWARILHVINSFLPPEVAFAPPGMTGEPEPRSVVGTPVPADDPKGALQMHLQFLDQHAPDAAWSRDTFVLAVRCGDRAAAQRARDCFALAAGEGGVDDGDRQRYLAAMVREIERLNGPTAPAPR